MLLIASNRIYSPAHILRPRRIALAVASASVHASTHGTMRMQQDWIARPSPVGASPKMVPTRMPSM
ncbi:hypothetical protein [Faucicola atlantae]|uniref:hypothetical protein n=1 Tax=Faucicola atlantae TaxID=34059 RepID=UPI0025AEF9B4|nr:hypothetical protein [Moraxella atlantae]